MINERQESRLKLSNHSQQVINEAPLRKKFIEAEKRNKIVLYAGKWDDFRVRREHYRTLYCKLRYRSTILRKMVIVKKTIHIVKLMHAVYIQGRARHSLRKLRVLYHNYRRVKEKRW